MSIKRPFLDCLAPKDVIDSSFRAIGGLQDQIKLIRKSFLPIMKPHLAAASPLMKAPTGILLWGPPGCGKTLMAKALAKESGLHFLNIKSSDIKCCFYGRTEEKISALFSLANNIEPVIIFIDEIDSILRSRSSEASNELSVTRGIKNLFMQHMDGLLNTHRKRVILIGATNRKYDIDQAILRRMHPKIYIGLPNIEQRREIFQNILAGEYVDPSIDFTRLANETTGFSGSEIRDVCRAAAMNILEETVAKLEAKNRNKSWLDSNSEPFDSASDSSDSDSPDVEPKKIPITKYSFFRRKQVARVKHQTTDKNNIRPFRTQDILEAIHVLENKATAHTKHFGLYT